jgi:DNA primase
LVRRQGNAGFQAMLDSARPLAEALYDMLRETGGERTPEQRAAFRTRLDTAARRIPDRALSEEYRRELQNRFFDEQRKGRPGPWRPTGQKFGVRRPGEQGFGENRRDQQRLGPPRPVATRTAPRPVPNADRTVAERMRVLTAILLRHPNLLRDVEHAYEALVLLPPLDRLRHALLDWAHGGGHAADVLDSEALMSHLTVSGIAAEAEQALAAVPVPLPSCASRAVMPAEAEAGWWHIFGFLSVERLREEVAMAEVALARDMTPENQNRLRARKEALIKVQSGEPDGIDLAA